MNLHRRYCSSGLLKFYIRDNCKGVERTVFCEADKGRAFIFILNIVNYFQWLHKANGKTMIDPKTQRLIEKLIDGSIIRKDRELLLNRMETDVSLKREFELRKELETIADEREYYLLKKRLQLASTLVANASEGKKQLDRKHYLKDVFVLYRCF